MSNRERYVLVEGPHFDAGREVKAGEELELDRAFAEQFPHKFRRAPKSHGTADADASKDSARRNGSKPTA